MITKEVRDWVKKIETRQYSFDDAMYSFNEFASCLTKSELIMLKRKLEELYQK